MFSDKMRVIIQTNSMSCRASFYAGRGVTTSDLNDTILFGIHKSIETTFGITAATEFVKMVKDLDDLSASSFLQALEIFEQSNYVWNTDFKENAQSFPVDQDNPAGMQLGILLSMQSTATKEDVLRDSNRLKFHFLKTKLPKEEYNAWQERHAQKDAYGDRYFSPFY